MERAVAYDYHDRALDYVRSARAAAGSMFGMAEEDADVRIAIAVEDYASGESQVALRVRRLDQQTRAVIDQMIAEGWIPPSTPVEEIGELRGFGARDLVAPLLAGVSCANERGSRGTLGCFVRIGAELFILSANHVLAREGHAEPESDIVQPSPGAEERRVIGVLHDFVPLTRFGNLMDAAIATVTVADLEPRLFNGKSITDVRTAPLVQGDVLFKFGQATEERAGVFHGMISNIDLPMDFDTYAFDGHIEARGAMFSCDGDSGALVYDRDDRAVGIVIGGDCSTRTIITPIARVLEKFHATLA